MSEQQRRLVVIGGGRGSSQVVLASQHAFAHASVIVAVTDTGRSTGIARTLGDIPAPGDLRNTLATLARDPDGLWARLLQFRLRSSAHPAYDGMAVGNVMLAGLTAMLGDIEQATQALAELVQPVGTVIPAALANVQLCAELRDGSRHVGELAVRGLDKAPIARLYLEPTAPANPAALAAIRAADVVVLGPGSFFTSVQAALLFDGMIDAIRETAARVVFIANTTTQPGQTDGFSAYDHVAALVELLGRGNLDVALINRSAELDPAVIANLAAQGLHLIAPSDAEIAAIAELGVQPLVADYAERSETVRELWNKLDTVRHDPRKLGAALGQLG